MGHRARWARLSWWNNFFENDETRRMTCTRDHRRDTTLATPSVMTVTLLNTRDCMAESVIFEPSVSMFDTVAVGVQLRAAVGHVSASYRGNVKREIFNWGSFLSYQYCITWCRLYNTAIIIVLTIFCFFFVKFWSVLEEMITFWLSFYNVVQFKLNFFFRLKYVKYCDFRKILNRQMIINSYRNIL